MKARNALSGPAAAFVLAGMWTAVIALWFVARPDGGGSIMLTLAVVSAPVWLAIGVQRLRARLAADERPTPPT
ncbi:hypothetical protein [Streptomyces sp. BSE7-9]|uniref:hypothetical protein n=1 Tax=Streptomyces sp. BSE7-9 TaxID=2759948 RepID=UPI0018EEA175|nr:hypothetical protein [Streptomyces sp. BSE7-9]MBJ6643607.1 hypothetical protein [Streptomyces sp. BSE7-9]